MTLDMSDVLDVALNCGAHDLCNISDSCVLRTVHEAPYVREDPFCPGSPNMQIISVIWGMSWWPCPWCPTSLMSSRVILDGCDLHDVKKFPWSVWRQLFMWRKLSRCYVCMFVLPTLVLSACVFHLRIIFLSCFLFACGLPGWHYVPWPYCLPVYYVCMHPAQKLHS